MQWLTVPENFIKYRNSKVKSYMLEIKEIFVFSTEVSKVLPKKPNPSFKPIILLQTGVTKVVKKFLITLHLMVFQLLTHVAVLTVSFFLGEGGVY